MSEILISVADETKREDLLEDLRELIPFELVDVAQRGEVVDWCKTHASVWFSDHRCEGRAYKNISSSISCVKVRARVEILK